MNCAMCIYYDECPKRVATNEPKCRLFDHMKKYAKRGKILHIIKK